MKTYLVLISEYLNLERDLPKMNPKIQSGVKKKKKIKAQEIDIHKCVR